MAIKPEDLIARGSMQQLMCGPADPKLLPTDEQKLEQAKEAKKIQVEQEKEDKEKENELSEETNNTDRQ